jgi:hypothetical protein
VTPLFEDWALTRLEAAMHAAHRSWSGQPATTKYSIGMWEREWRNEVQPHYIAIAQSAAAAHQAEEDAPAELPHLIDDLRVSSTAPRSRMWRTSTTCDALSSWPASAPDRPTTSMPASPIAVPRSPRRPP